MAYELSVESLIEKEEELKEEEDMRLQYSFKLH